MHISVSILFDFMNITIKILNLACSYFWASAVKFAKIIIIIIFTLDSIECTRAATVK